MTDLKPLLRDLKFGLQSLYGERLAHVVLYGSYAREEARQDSDVDILIVFKGEFDRSLEMARTSELISDLSLTYDTVVSRMFKSERQLERQASSLIRNVSREGVPL